MVQEKEDLVIALELVHHDANTCSCSPALSVLKGEMVRYLPPIETLSFN